MAMAQEPKVLLLDEPTQGLSVEETAQAVDTLARFLERSRVTALLVEHDMEVVFGLASRVVVLHQGKVIADDMPQQIREDRRVRDIYLGDASVAPILPRKEIETGAPLLRVEHLDAGYGLAHVLHDVTFTVARGEIVALLGRNGMGKTTTLRSVAGLNRPWRGSAVFLAEKPIAGNPPDRVAALGVS